MWTPIVNRKFKDDESLRAFIQGLQFTWRPSLIVWHNTAAPTLAQWLKTAASDAAAKIEPGQTRINSLVSYFRDNQHWSAGPHAFVAPDGVWAFTPFNQKGVHSPSWNGIAIGIEMVGDFDTEDDENGPGAQVKKRTIALTAMLCERLGLNPEIAIKLHKEDPRTTHACPGKNIARDKAAMIQSVLEYMGEGGDHSEEKTPETREGVTMTPGDTLNLRDKSSAAGKILTQLKDGTAVTVLNEAVNGETKWLLIQVATIQGWVAAKFVKEG